MDGMKEAFEIVFGEEFINEMATRLIIIACSLAVILIVVLVISIRKTVACKKINKALLALSEHPDNEHAEICIKSVSGMSSFGRFLLKHSKGFSGISKGECRSIYNQTVLTSDNISLDNKKEVRINLIKIGCKGLTEL